MPKDSNSFFFGSAKWRIVPDTTSFSRAESIARAVTREPSETRVIDFSGFVVARLGADHPKMIDPSDAVLRVMETLHNELSSIDLAEQGYDNALFGLPATEVNFSTSLWKSVIQVRAADEIIRSSDRAMSVSLPLGHPYFSTAALGLFPEMIRFRQIYRLTTFVISLMIVAGSVSGWLWNLLMELLAALVFRRYRPAYSVRAAKHLFFSTQSTQVDGVRPHLDRIFGGRPHDAGSASVVRCLYRNGALLSGPTRILSGRPSSSEELSFFPLESWLRARDIFSSYLSTNGPTANGTLELLRTLGLRFLGRSLFYQWRLLHLPKQKSLRKLVARATRSFPEAVLAVVPIFELVEGRSIVLTLREAGLHVFGVQHGALTKAHLLRFGAGMRIAKQLNCNSIPHEFLVEGSYAAEGLRELDLTPVRVIGAMRIESKLLEETTWEPERGVVLVALDLHNWKSGLEAILEISRLGQFAHFYIKPHPSRVRSVQRYVDKLDVGSYLSVAQEGSLHNLVTKLRPSFAIVGQTGASIDLVMLRCPIAMFGCGSGFRTNPLMDAIIENNLLLWPTKASFNEIAIRFTGESRERLLSSLLDNVFRQVDSVGSTATHQFNRLIRDHDSK